MVARQERPVEHQMHTLARGEQRLRLWVVHTPQLIGVDAGGVDRRMSGDLELFVGLGVASQHTRDAATGFDQAGDRRVVQSDTT